MEEFSGPSAALEQHVLERDLGIQNVNSVSATTDGSSSPVEWNVGRTTESALRDVGTSERD